jgi:putative transposase
MPLAEFEAIVRRELAFYNAQAGRRGQGMNGRSFDQVFAEGLARWPPPQAHRRAAAPLPAGLQAGLMDPQSGAVAVEGHRYWSPELGEVKRQKVIVRFDPEAMDQPAYVYSLDGRCWPRPRMMAGSFDAPATAASTARRSATGSGPEAAGPAARRLDARDVAARLAARPPPAPVEPRRKVVRLGLQGPAHPRTGSAPPRRRATSTRTGRPASPAAAGRG